MKKPYTLPDLKAPRHRITRLTWASQAFHRAFYKKHPEHKGIPPIEVKRILRAFNANIREAIINERDGAEFPEGLGYCFVGSCVPKKSPNPNREASRTHKVDIQHTNMNSDGFVAKIFYTNFANKYKFRMRELWTFKGSRDLKRGVSVNYRENWKSYMTVDNFKTLRDSYNRAKNRDYAIKMTKISLVDYNEFDMN